MRNSSFGLLLFLGLLPGLAGGEKKALESGPPPGSRTPFFHPLHVNGPFAERQVSIVQCYLSRPFVMVFAREINDPLIDLLKKLDVAAGETQDEPQEDFRPFRGRRLGSCMILLTGNHKAREQWTAKLKGLVAKQKFKYTILAFMADDPPSYKLHNDAEITVLIINRWIVHARYAFRKDELDARAMERILAELPKILPKKNQDDK